MFEVVNNVIEGLRKIREVSQRIQNAELQNLVADLMINAADLRIELAQAKEDNIKLREEIADIKRRRDLRSNIEYRGTLVYLKTLLPGYPDGPFCPCCLENEGKLHIMWEDQFAGWHCTNAKAHK